MHGDACHDAWNGSGTDFGASQCFPMDLDAAARCVHNFTLAIWLTFALKCSIMGCVPIFHDCVN